MSFPQTRLTLIQRLAAGGSQEDWTCFVRDYRGPVCRFALRWGAPNLHDAEDIAAETFQIIWENGLLGRWLSNRSSKLRSLVCGVVRNILSNRYRVNVSRSRQREEVIRRVEELSRLRDQQADGFYAAWVEDILQRSMERLGGELFAEGKGDLLRVLYGRLCEGLTIAQVAEALEISPAAVDRYFRQARQRLATHLEDLLRCQISRYCPPEEVGSEFRDEWQRLGQYLKRYGGIEEAVARAYELLDPVRQGRSGEERLAETMTRLTSLMRRSPGATSSEETT